MSDDENDDLGLYCQNCCERYIYCIYKDLLDEKDRFAEYCPDFLPKDIYKAVDMASISEKSPDEYISKSRTSCFYKRKSLEPDFRPLPEDVPISLWGKEALAGARKYAYEKILEEHEILDFIQRAKLEDIKNYLKTEKIDKELRRIISEYIRMR